MYKKIIFITLILVVFFISGCIQEKIIDKTKRIPSDMAPSLYLELNSYGELKVGNEILIKLVLTPTSAGLGKEFFDTPAKIKFNLPNSFELTEGSLEQDIYFNDFKPKTVEIKVKPSKKGIFDIRVDVKKQNIGEYWETLSVGIDSKFLTDIECQVDNDCGVGGCSGTVCQSKNTEPIFTTCEWKEEYTCYKQIDCGCVNNKCEWKKTKEFEDCKEKARKPSS